MKEQNGMVVAEAQPLTAVKNGEQMVWSLFQPLPTLDVTNVFQRVSKTNASGGTSVALKLRKSKDIADALGVERKDVTEAILSETDAMRDQIADAFSRARNNESFTGVRFAATVTKKGKVKVTAVLASVDKTLRKKAITDEKYVDFMNGLGQTVNGRPWTVADVKALRDKQNAELNGEDSSQSEESNPVPE